MNNCKYLNDKIGYCKRKKNYRFTPKWFCYHVCANYKPKKINMTKVMMKIMPLVIGLAVQKKLEKAFEEKEAKRND
jgi:hypothetical protein